jgi:hypothetical protein
MKQLMSAIVQSGPAGRRQPRQLSGHSAGVPVDSRRFLGTAGPVAAASASDGETQHGPLTDIAVRAV